MLVRVQGWCGVGGGMVLRQPGMVGGHDELWRLNTCRRQVNS